MTIFYRGPCVTITHKVFETRCPTRRAFRVDGLRRVHVVMRRTAPPAAAYPIRVGSGSVAGTAAVTLTLSQVEGLAMYDAPLAQLAVLGLLVVSAIVSGACCRTVREYELAADYHGEPASLYRTTDAREFGQVGRALQRALERHHGWRLEGL